MKDLTIELFDVIPYLEDKRIEFVTEGKDVTEGWIGLSCLWCDDNGHHLGINLEGNFANCWKCGSKGSVIKIVQALENNCSWQDALEIMEKYQNPERFTFKTIHEQTYQTRTIKFPSEFKKIDYQKIFPIVKSYLKERGFNPETICRNKELYYPDHLGDYKFRLILPIYMNRRLVGFTSRDVTNKSPLPYKNIPDDKAVIPVKETLYGFDEITPGSNVVVVEGPFDQWKLGPGSVATYGTSYTIKQISLLRELKPAKIIILYDNEKLAQDSAYRMSQSIWFCEVEIWTAEGVKDPGEMRLDETREIMRSLGNL